MIKKRNLSNMTRDEFRNVRLDNGLTQVEFSKKLGLSLRQIGQLENGSQPIRLVIEKLVKAYWPDSFEPVAWIP